MVSITRFETVPIQRSFSKAWQQPGKLSINQNISTRSPKRSIRKERKSYQLVQIPSANAHVTLVLIHALTEVADISLTGGVLPRAVGSAALVQAGVHGLVLGRSLLGGLGGGT